MSQARRTTIRTADWVTLREASEATGIPVGTLGSWARRGNVDSYLEGNGGRKIRIVDLNDVRGRARELGRPVAPVPVRAAAPRPPSRVDTSTKAPPPDENVMIVPLDAWTKVLNQLGNLHEAGQQLAEARERAAKAETEAEFLRQRLAELRAAGESSPPGRNDVVAPEAAKPPLPQSDPSAEPWMPQATESQPSGAPEPESTQSLGFLRSLVATWRERRR